MPSRSEGAGFTLRLGRSSYRAAVDYDYGVVRPAVTQIFANRPSDAYQMRSIRPA